MAKKQPKKQKPRPPRQASSLRDRIEDNAFAHEMKNPVPKKRPKA